MAGLVYHFPFSIFTAVALVPEYDIGHRAADQDRYLTISDLTLGLSTYLSTKFPYSDRSGGV